MGRPARATRLHSFLLAALFLLFELGDFLITSWAIKHGVSEMNMLAEPLVGTAWYPVIKLAFPLAAVGYLLSREKKNRRSVFWIMFGLALAGFVVLIVQVTGLIYFISQN